MLEQSLFRTKGLPLWLTPLLLIVFLYSGKVLSSDPVDQTAIVDTYLQASSEDRALAQSLVKQARTRGSTAGHSIGTNSGPLVKLWCEAAVIAPDPENLSECARFRFEDVEHMSNPQPSEEAVRLQRARESLIMIRAALEIAGGDPNVSDELRYRLKSNFKCFRELISGKGASKSCN